jgi:hypothetical protein
MDGGDPRHRFPTDALIFFMLALGLNVICDVRRRFGDASARVRQPSGTDDQVARQRALVDQAWTRRVIRAFPGRVGACLVHNAD